MKLTRPQRTQLAWTLFVVGCVVFMWMIWSQRLIAFTATPTGTTTMRQFGLVRYLTITSISPRGLSAVPSTLPDSSDWQWKPTAVAINMGITLAVLGVLGFTCIRMVRKDRLKDRCDECGYDLTGLHSETCPECGTKVGASR